MFFDRFKELCQEKGISVYKACTDIGLNRSAVNKWKQGGQPNGTTLASFAKYFGVSVDYLLGNVSEPYFHLDNDRILADINSYETENAPALTERDRRDIARDLEDMMAHLESSGDLMFYGDPMSDEARESIRAAMKLGLEAAKLKNKELYTPKKYRKG